MLAHFDVLCGLGVGKALERVLQVLGRQCLRLPEELEVPVGGEGREVGLPVLVLLVDGGVGKIAETVRRPSSLHLRH